MANTTLTAATNVYTPAEFDRDCTIVYGYLQDKLSAVNKAQEEAEELERLDGVNTSWDVAHCEVERSYLEDLFTKFFHDGLAEVLKMVEEDAANEADLAEWGGNSDTANRLLDVSWAAEDAWKFAVANDIESY